MALEHRKQLAGHASEAQTLAFLRDLRDDFDLNTQTGVGLYGPSDTVLAFSSNQSRADIFSVADSSNAVIRAGEQGGWRRPGMLASQCLITLNENAFERNVFTIVGKDRERNY
ncbi:hypothetical protein FKW77_009391 [Venturia effusa]|uniref:Uncharacterized protein n=1 Tax=Venturia effusa TaxID=50376 RepID=A0A517LG99_9PEZI|nr:hypothetical protein FKW77_009391 [Venturia effusa]